MTKPSVCAVTINFGPPDDTLDCVASLQGGTYPALRTIVVDNGSAAEHLERLQRHLPDDVELIVSPVNLGFSGGCNLGIRGAIAAGDEYVLLINNDATLEPKALGRLVTSAQRLERPGVVTGKIYASHGSDPSTTLWYAGGWWSPVKAAGYSRGLGEEDRGQYDESGETIFIPGCLWLVPTEVFATVGLLDEAFFLYTEDLHYCLELRRRGYRLWYDATAICHHRVSRSHWHERHRASPTLNYYSNRNRFIIARRWLTPVQRLACYGYLVGSRLALALRHRDRSYLMGLWDGWRGRTGPRP